MAKVKTVTLSYTERRSVNYQAVEYSEQVTLEIEDGDDVEKVRKEARAELCKRVRAVADRAVQDYSA